MALYTVENTYRAGRPVERVTDANGLEYDHCLEVDTETGRILKLKVRGGYYVRDGGGLDVAREVVWAAPPVTVRFAGGR